MDCNQYKINYKMNLNKFTKAELISKIKNLENNSKINNQNISNIITNYFRHIWELIFTLKNLLLKLTLFSLIIKIFKKYSIFRRLWLILKTFVMSIFGISLIDNFGFNLITNFINEIKMVTSNITDYLSNTHFYTYLSKLFNKNEVIEPSSESTNKSRSMIESNKTETTGSTENSSKSEGNSRISEWLKPQKEAYDEIKEQINNDTNYKYYFIIAGIIIIGCLSWVYMDDIKTWYNGFIEWINSFRAGPPNNDSGGNNNNNNNNPTNNPTNIIERSTSPDIELVANSKGKEKLFTSPSLDDLNKKISESWADNNPPGSPDSIGSSETIKPSNIQPSEPSGSNNQINAIELALLNRVNNEWKSMIPSHIKSKMDFIEDNIKLSADFFIRKQLLNNLAEIDCSLLDLGKDFDSNYIKPEELIQIELIKNNLAEWINEYNNKIFEKDLI